MVVAMEFWTEDDPHQDLAKELEKSIEVRHPDSVSSDRFSRVCKFCGWGNTCVEYYGFSESMV